VGLVKNLSETSRMFSSIEEPSTVLANNTPCQQVSLCFVHLLDALFFSVLFVLMALPQVTAV